MRKGSKAAGSSSADFEQDGLVFELLAQGGAVPGAFAHELPFHAAFVLKKNFLRPPR